MPETLSTTALAKLRNIEPKQLFNDLKTAGYINRDGDNWVLTEVGKKFGGSYANHPKFGQFIVWPENLLVALDATSGQTLTATQLGQRLKLNAKKINQLLGELGWIENTEQGWKVTSQGLIQGGSERTDKSSGRTFVVWHDTTVHNKRLKQSVSEFSGHDAEAHATDKSITSFRQKFEAKHRTLDGHYVRSKAELIIDNWLYMNGVVHAYDRQLPIEEDVLGDFYLPSGRVYIQYWGSDQGEMDSKTIEQTRAIYQRNEFALIELYADDIEQLDEVLGKRLREFGIKAY
ncbi:glycerol kinase [Vibrio sp. SCSIO 43136]|uniref:glycerol kinase n=1 Tax=Vibrio sp. SCSIO 43136 TaxID=2819101 RepID=UPI002075156F|nr:glycerol kinase [Vibrio sp. SCSIO 43136]USD65816.1 glycerol kinase [Vibrio sp. SCSIO 43136]